MEQAKLLTVKEVANLLKVSTVTVYNWINLKILKAYKIGNQTRLKENEVLGALELKKVNQ